MRVIYADDEPTTLAEVQAFLEEHHHTVRTISTANLFDFQEQITALLKGDFGPEVIILGGHNFLRDSEGKELVGVGALEINAWLEKRELPAPCHFILFSHDEDLVEFANRQHQWGFTCGILKGRADSLSNLLQALTPA